MNNYYDCSIKKMNISLLKKYPNFQFRNEDIRTTQIIKEWKPDKVCHLASMAGVRYSIEHPSVYISVNINGFISRITI